MVFSQVLVEWYAANKRILPWRETVNPYYIWVSEVILQQTRVAQGIDYYLCFIRAFPTVFDLAAADIDRVLKVWQGLGYYTRARNMHVTAKEIVERHNGSFPRTYKELIKLKGVGDYTASAVAAFAFGEAVAAVDGNVYRIFARIFGVDTPIDTQKGKQELKAIADNMLDKEHPGVYNQAIMDFGGTVCMPRKPNCLSCPVMEICSAFRNRKVEQYPVNRIGLPAHDLALTGAIALRFLPILGEQMEAISLAQASRGVASASKSRIKLVENARRLAGLIMPLLVDAYRRAEELALAMQSRCYQGGKGRTYLRELVFQRTDIAAMALSVLVLVLVIVAQRLVTF